MTVKIDARPAAAADEPMGKHPRDPARPAKTVNGRPRSSAEPPLQQTPWTSGFRPSSSASSRRPSQSPTRQQYQPMRLHLFAALVLVPVLQAQQMHGGPDPDRSAATMFASSDNSETLAG